MNMHAFRWLLRPDASDSDRHRCPRRRPGRRDGGVSGRGRRAGRELLEDRRLLATIEVTSLADNLDTDGRVTLREAILAAEIDASVDGSAAGDGADQIVFAPSLPPEPLRLLQAADDTWGLSAFRITTPLAIVANGRVLNRDADAPQFRFFYVDPTGQLELTGLTLARGAAPGPIDSLPTAEITLANGVEQGSGLGGAILNSGQLVLNSVHLSQNSAAHGGAMAVVSWGDQQPVASVTMNRSTLADNVAEVAGGGVYIAAGEAWLTSSNSTISGNAAAMGGGIWNAGHLDLMSCTITANAAPTAAGVANDTAGSVHVRNTIIAGNTADRPGDTADRPGDTAGRYLSAGHNLIGDVGQASGFDGPEDRVGGGKLPVIDPRLGPLQFNGGLTPTHLLQWNSPAIDAGDSTDVSDVDQRGMPRIADGNANDTATVDIGAFEENPILIDNDLAAGTPGQFAFDVLPGGASRGGRGGITAQGKTTLFSHEDVIYDYFHYVDVGSDGGAVSLRDTDLLQPTTLIADDTAVSEGTLRGERGPVRWRVESHMADGASSVVSTITFTSSGPLGNLRFISYLDEDIVDAGDDLLLTAGRPGHAGFLAFTVDAAERIGFGHGGIYEPGSGLHNATFDGWTANRFADLQIDLEGNGTAYSIDGQIHTDNLVPRWDDELGQVYGPEDVTTAFAWTVDPTATTATITSTLDFGSVVPGSLHGFLFDDRDGNGVFAAEFDAPLSDAPLTLTGIDNTGQAVDRLAVTDADGKFAFTGLLPSVRGTSFATGYEISYALPQGQRSRTHEVVATGQGARQLIVHTDLLSGQELVPFVGDAALGADDPRREELRTDLRFGTYFAQETGLIAGYVAAADLDLDGRQDLVVANDYADPLHFRSSLSLLFGEGRGGFAEPLTIGLPDYSRPQAVAIGDVTGDARPDLIVASVGDPTRCPAVWPAATDRLRTPVDPQTNAILIYAHTGQSERNQLFAADPIVLLGGTDLPSACHLAAGASDSLRCDGPISIALADVNSDKLLDLIVAGFRSDTITILRQPFAEQPPVHLSVGRAPVAVRATNVNDDPLADLIVVNHDAGGVSILLGRGDATFRPAAVITDVEHPADVVATDLNGDAQVDLAVANYDLAASAQEAEVRIFLVGADGTFPRAASQRIRVAPGAQSLAASDLDGDGDRDLVVTGADAGTITLLQNVALNSGQFRAVSEYSVATIRDTAAAPSPQTVIAADLDGDLDADDIAVAHFAFGVTLNFNGLPVAARLPRAESPADLWADLDVDRDGFVLPLDALLIVNHLNERPAERRHATVLSDAFDFDVNGDGHESPIDALLVLNYLNAESKIAGAIQLTRLPYAR